MIVLPIYKDQSSRFRYTIELDNTPFVFEYYWNTRSAGWFINILNQQHEPLLCNLFLTPNMPLLKPYRGHTHLPKGQLFVILADDNNEDRELLYDDLGEYYRLVYLERSELYGV